MTSNNFSWIPNVKITGSNQQKIDSTTLESINVDSTSVKIILDKNYAQNKGYATEYSIFEFNTKPGIHIFNQPEDEEFPIELSYAYSIDLLEEISIQNKLSTILYSEQPKSFIGAFFALNNKVSLPFLVRRPDKTLFSGVYLFTSIYGNLLTSLESVTDQYEDYIENALYTFSENVIQPLQDTQDHTRLPDDLIRVLDRAEDLYSIILDQIVHIRDRYRAYSRLLVPLIHYAYLKSDLESSMTIEYESDSTIKYSIKTPRELESKILASILAEKLAD